MVEDEVCGDLVELVFKIVKVVLNVECIFECERELKFKSD